MKKPTKSKVSSAMKAQQDKMRKKGPTKGRDPKKPNPYAKKGR